MIRKRIIHSVLIFLCLFCTALPVRCYAEMVGTDKVYDAVNDVMNECDTGLEYSDAESLNLNDIIGKLKTAIADKVQKPIRDLVLILVSVFAFSVFKTINPDTDEKNGNIYNMVCVLSVMVVITPELLNLYNSVCESISKCGMFISVFVPLFSGITLATGGLTTSGAYDILILGVSEFIVMLSNTYLLPVLSVLTGLSFTGSITSETSVESIIKSIRKIIVWTLTVAMTLYTGFVSLKCTLTGKTDNAVTKTAKYVISGFVPIVGGAVTDAYSSVRSSFEAIHCTTGTLGILAVVLIILPPVAEILIYRMVICIGTGTAEMMSAEPIGKLLRSIDSGLAIAQCILICYSLIFIISSAIIIKSL